MEIEKLKSIIEAMLFAAGREIKQEEIMSVLEISADDLDKIIHTLQDEYVSQNRGIEIIKINNCYQLTTKKEYYEYIKYIDEFPITFDNDRQIKELEEYFRFQIWKFPDFEYKIYKIIFLISFFVISLLIW